MTRRPSLPPGGFTPSIGSDFGPAIRALCNSMAAAFCIIAAHVRFVIAGINVFNKLRCQWMLKSHIEPQRLFARVSN